MRAPLAAAALATVATVAAATAAAVPAAAQDTHLLLVTGLGGDPAYSEVFRSWAGTVRQAAVEAGVPEGRITWLAEDPGALPGVVSARSSLENLEGAVADLTAASSPGDRVLVVFIGHGTSRGDGARFNLPGPDPTGADVAALLEPLADRTVAVVNTAPSSGPWIEALSGPGRIVVTATKTARERNETRFGEHFAGAFRDDAADLDKDGRVSLLEAFTYARSEVARSYEESNLLVTEHAVLDDDGDGVGVEEPAPGAREDATTDGVLASRFWLGGGRDGRATTATGGVPDDVTDPELRALYEERVRLEEEVAALRDRRSEMEETAYEAELERLLLELAVTSRAIREREGGGG